MTRRRVVVTGLGIVSPVGIGLAKAWESIVNARSGVAAITRFDASTFPTRIAAEVKDFDVGTYLSAKEARRYDTFIHYGLVATMEAVVVDVAADGRVRLENEDWSQPTLQERRAIIHAAQEELLALGELLEILQADR